VTFLRPTAGNQNGSVVSLCMAGVARRDRVYGMGLDTQSVNKIRPYATPASESQLCDE
jgi:hypothetical protein